MLWFNIKELERRLRNNEVSDKEGYYYLLANMILLSLFTCYSGEEEQSSLFCLIQTVLIVIITIIGIRTTYHINRDGDRQEYFKRFPALYFVVSIRLFVFLIVLLIPVVTIDVLFFDGFIFEELSQDFMEISFIALIEAAFYYLLINSFKRVAQPETS